MALTAFLYAKAVGNAQALDPAAFCMPECAWRGMFDRKPSLTNARSIALIIQDRDGSLIKEPRKPRPNQLVSPSYRVEFPAALLDEQNSLIDRIISFAFDTLGARRLDVRVREAE